MGKGTPFGGSISEVGKAGNWHADRLDWSALGEKDPGKYSLGWLGHKAWMNLYRPLYIAYHFSV